ncbi:MAG: hypothetical protein D6724_08800 [Armatimonadetes bacterium]|nr:MAG: hypothetical protein D6724_08800 [Armatimonadota bacterium]
MTHSRRSGYALVFLDALLISAALSLAGFRGTTPAGFLVFTLAVAVGCWFLRRLREGVGK